MTKIKTTTFMTTPQSELPKLDLIMKALQPMMFDVTGIGNYSTLQLHMLTILSKQTNILNPNHNIT